jgi:hypothetical protein
MWGPLAVLAALSLGGGFINIPKFLEPLFPIVARASRFDRQRHSTGLHFGLQQIFY